MVSAKEIRVAPINAAAARQLVARYHYSGKVVNNSKLHLGVFYDGHAEGVMSFGKSMKPREMLPLVSGTSWNGALELNRMAFSDKLPRNSESRALAVAFRMIRKHYPHIEWVVSFSDACQCGDGAIYRASGFCLVDIKRNKTLYRLPDGRVVNNLCMTGRSMITDLRARPDISSAWSYRKNARVLGAEPVGGFQIKYVYFLNPAARERLTVPILPFSRIAEMGASMYRGERTRPKQATPATSGEAAGQNRPGRSNIPTAGTDEPA
jgi:hypothetical protein